VSIAEPPKRNLGFREAEDFLVREALGFLLLEVVEEGPRVFLKHDEHGFEKNRLETERHRLPCTARPRQRPPARAGP
jgi:hypothetical protein